MKPNFAILTLQGPHHEWLAYASWYSIHRMMPESKVVVVFPRSGRAHLFTWLNRCHVPYLTYGAGVSPEQAVAAVVESEDITRPVVVLRDTMMVIREIEGPVEGIVPAEELPSFGTARSEEPKAVVDCHVCGQFDLAEWMESQNRHPFYQTHKLAGKNRTVNEVWVLDLWKQAGATFDFLNRGT